MNTVIPNSLASHATSTNHLAVVETVTGVEQSGRVEVRLLSYDGPDTQDGVVSARLCVPFAGPKRGAFFVPDVGDEVLVTFVNGDPRSAVVLGSLWNGDGGPDEKLAGNRVDRWSLTGKSGTRIAIVEERGGAKVELSTSAGGGEVSSITVDRGSGGQIELSAGGTTLTIDAKGIRLQTSGKYELQSASADMTCATVNINSGISQFMGVVDATCVKSPAVVGQSYTPGAGNVW